jgi:acetyl-CoA carboxylase biotin carboxyl carrier protein
MAVHEYRAEMVANVLTVLVEPGQSVVSGDTLIMLESMKMEIPIFADADGVVAEVPVQPADVVQEGDILAVVNQ